jgi:hypothetical protein
MYITIIRREKLDSQVPPIDVSIHVSHFLEGRTT